VDFWSPWVLHCDRGYKNWGRDARHTASIPLLSVGPRVTDTGVELQPLPTWTVDLGYPALAKIPAWKGVMSNIEKAASLLSSPEVDQLLVLCEEVTRATPEAARRFIEPAPGVLSRAKSKQHNIIFGRRGSGKSSLLRKVAADLTIDRRPISFVDMETFKGHSYPDVLISVLIKSLHEFRHWLTGAATAPATKTSFGRSCSALPQNGHHLTRLPRKHW
jgi:hypothetical protein